MQRLQPRQIDILEIARKEGRVEVEGLSTRFEVTPQTIRKDLNELCELEKLQRVHGGRGHHIAGLVRVEAEYVAPE